MAFLSTSVYYAFSRTEEKSQSRLQEVLLCDEKKALVTDIFLAAIVTVIATLAILAAQGTDLGIFNPFGAIGTTGGYVLIGVSTTGVLVNFVVYQVQLHKRTHLLQEKYTQERLTPKQPPATQPFIPLTTEQPLLQPSNITPDQTQQELTQLQTRVQKMGEEHKIALQDAMKKVQEAQKVQKEASDQFSTLTEQIKILTKQVESTNLEKDLSSKNLELEKQKNIQLTSDNQLQIQQLKQTYESDSNKAKVEAEKRATEAIEGAKKTNDLLSKSLTDQISEQQKQIKKINSENVSALEKFQNENTQKLQLLQKTLSTKETEFTQATTNLRLAQEDFAQKTTNFNQQIQELQTQLEALQTQMNTAGEEAAQVLSKTKQEAQAQATALQSQSQNLTTQLDEMSTRMKTADQEANQKFQLAEEKARQEIRTLQQQNHLQAAQILNLTQEKESLLEKVKLNEEIDALQQKVKSLKSQEAELATKNTTVVLTSLQNLTPTKKRQVKQTFMQEMIDEIASYTPKNSTDKYDIRKMKFDCGTSNKPTELGKLLAGAPVATLFENIQKFKDAEAAESPNKEELEKLAKTIKNFLYTCKGKNIPLKDLFCE